jgi:hypothetical protein
MAEFCNQNKTWHLRSFLGGVVFATLTVGAVYGLFARVVQQFLVGAVTVGDLAVFGTAGLCLRTAVEAAISSSNRAWGHTPSLASLQEFLQMQPQLPRTGELTLSQAN